MRSASYRAQPEGAAAVELFELVLTGPLRRVEANADGSWTVTPTTGSPLILTGPAQVAAYVQQAQGTGPQALAPATPAPEARPAWPTAADEAGCGCAPAARVTRDVRDADMMQAHAIYRHLADWIDPSRRSWTWNADAEAASVRVSAPHGLYELFIPPVARAFPVFLRGRRDGALSARRVPATTDSLAATLYASYLRDRGDL